MLPTDPKNRMKANKIELELCTDSVEGAEMASTFGLNRIELCSALSEGGLTPSYGLIKAVRESANCEIHLMIRPYGGPFQMDSKALNLAETDMERAADLGVEGVVFGLLTEDNGLDLKHNARLLSKAKGLGLQCTFHRAFDFVSSPKNALEQLIDLGFDRLLTSGQKDKAIDGLDLLLDLVNQSSGRIQVMAGSGVNAQNARAFLEAGIRHLHFTSHQINAPFEQLSMGQKFEPNPAKVNDILALASDFEQGN